jgi:alanine dehydrogenase
MAIYLSESDVDALADMELALAAVESSMARQGRGTSSNVGRRRARIKSGALNLMGAADQELGVAGAKLYSAFPGGSTRFVVILFDIITGSLQAVIEAGRLGELRTGAATGIATKYLARENSSIVGLIGSGRQARTQLLAIHHLRTISEVRVWSRNPSHVETFVGDMRPQLDAPINKARTASEAVSDADIVVTATSAATPVIDASDLVPGMHVTAMGSNNPRHTELSPDAIAEVDRVFVDDLDGAHEECGDLIVATQAGQFQWGQATELGRVVAGEIEGRTTTDQITLFESQGIALWDIALAHAIVQRAASKNRGTRIG